jgi:hypothetical protein
VQRRRSHLSPTGSASVSDVVVYQSAHPWQFIID